jgi:hypothetical protein
VSPELKEELNREAAALGQTSSEYGEAILHNRHRADAEIAQLKQAIIEGAKAIEDLNLQQLMLKGKQQDEFANYKKEIESLKERLAVLVPQNDIFNDERLNYLFQQLKGKKDVVENVYGDDFPISYDSLESVLIAFIYSSKLNK